MKCRSCGEEIIWIKTDYGKRMPCDPGIVLLDASEIGNDKIITPDGLVWSGTVVSGCIDDDKSKIVEGYQPHWANCPGANEFRKGEKR